MTEFPSTIYALLHRPTGVWMPAQMTRRGRGWSHWNPDGLDDKPYNSAPRVFYTKNSAQGAKAQWLRGVHKVIYSPQEDDRTRLEVPRYPRRAQDLEIVELRVVTA